MLYGVITAVLMLLSLFRVPRTSGEQLSLMYLMGSSPDYLESWELAIWQKLYEELSECCLRNIASCLANSSKSLLICSDVYWRRVAEGLKGLAKLLLITYLRNKWVLSLSYTLSKYFSIEKKNTTHLEVCQVRWPYLCYCSFFPVWRVVR